MSEETNGAPQPLPAGVVDRLLDLLSSDDAFRDLFSSDPASALAQVGHHADATGLAQLGQRLAVQQLAPKETIAAARDEIRASLTSGLSMQPIQLDTGGTTN